MHFSLFYHSLLSDWNHGNAHFLRGYASELMRRGHQVRVFEPRGSWSLTNLLRDHGESALEPYRRHYPGLESEIYDPAEPALEAWLSDTDVVIVHEWNDPALVRKIGEHRRESGRYVLLFHDTHHRLISQPEEMQRYDLSAYDAVLAFGQVLRDLYLARGLCSRAFTWHEAADTHIFKPKQAACSGELVWVGNWGEEERTAELREFLLEPARQVGLETRVHGVRYPAYALAELSRSGIHYAGFLPNSLAPDVYAQHLMTVHVPRRPYVEALSGVPTIRVFEALACGIPLLTAPWDDTEHLFSPGRDYLVARSGAEMAEHLALLRHDASLRRSLAEHGLQTIAARHTCAHRVDELLDILAQLRAPHDMQSQLMAPDPGGDSPCLPT